MKYWTYTPENYKELNDQLRREIDHTPKGIQSQKQPTSHYDGYNHKKSRNANYPEFQMERVYKPWVDEHSKMGYIEYPPPAIDKSPDQKYKITFWNGAAPLVKQFAREVAVRSETELNYHITVSVMWFHRRDKGDYDNWHNHTHCQWVGVYYIDLPKGEETLLIDYEGNIFQPEVKEGQLLIFPSGYIHKSPYSYKRKTLISFNFNVGSKYTIDMINKVKETHPKNFFDSTKGITSYKD